MKILFDKILKPPGHSLTRKKCKQLISIVPDEWIASFDSVHFSNQMPEKSILNKRVMLSKHEKRLIVLSRGISEIQTAEDILIELVHNLPAEIPYQRATSISKDRLSNIKKIIGPYLKKYRLLQKGL